MNNRFTNWSDIRVFLAVLRTGSTLAASKTLGMAQPTVARRIEALEHTLGLMLFDRDTRGFKATEAALALKTDAEAMEMNASSVAITAKTFKSTASKAIRVTGVPEVLSENFAVILSDFTDQHPEITFDFLATPETLDLANDEADVAIRYVNEVTDPSLICRKMFSQPMALYASQAYVKKYGLPASQDDFSDHKFVVMSGGMRKFRDWITGRITPDQIVMECDSYNSVVAAILSGFGIGLLSTGLALDKPSLTRVVEPIEDFTVNTWLITSPQAHKHPRCAPSPSSSPRATPPC
ncbi:LysR family transcriptional regulator [Boseongicola aestuarii]|uniref:HTH-type transcriptional regulator CynR n=1 Tax=Boseongicola aestuarii TaxID=1470561 RepID=A0A238J2E7_9RHOB|nr:LysR family transcriptional regulator [Boseongicola aestuarii]SMX24878.1 HTH-type transcriptional regulator CynR [Boseongicola aestuarii]